MRILFAFFLTALIICSANAQKLAVAPNRETAGFSAKRLERIDKQLEAYGSNAQIPGAVALVTRDGKIIYYKAFGFSDLEKKAPLKKTDIFRIASQTKAIVSLAVMMLWEEGKFLLDDPVHRYIPEFKAPKILKSFSKAASSFTTGPAKSEITIRHLLTHTSGIDYPEIGGIALC